MDIRAATTIAKDAESTANQLESAAGVSEVIDRLLAKHPKSNTSLLEKLSHSSDKATRKNVALNANAEKVVLIRLAPQFPGDFFRNPAFDWLLLEDPGLLFEIGAGVLKNILKRPECPASFMDWAVKHGSEQEKLAVTMNPEAPVESLKQLAKAGGKLGGAAQQHAKLQANDTDRNAIDVEKEFVNGLKSSLAVVTSAEAKSAWKRGVIGPHQWPWLSLGARLAVKRYPLAAFVPVLLPQYAESLVAENSDTLNMYLTQDPSTPAQFVQSILEGLASRQPSFVAKHPATSQVLLEKIESSVSVYQQDRMLVAANANCSHSLFVKFSVDADYWVRRTVAGNSKCPPDLLSKLAGDPEVIVRQPIANNPSTSRALLEQLSTDSDEDLAATARARLAEVPIVPPSDWHAAAKAKKADVRLAVAKHPSAPPSVLESLCRGANPAMWRNLAFNPASPETVCERAFDALIKRAGPKQLEAYALNPACPTHLRHLASARLFRKLVNAERSSRSRGEAIPKTSNPIQLMEWHRQECQKTFLSPEDCLFARLIGCDPGQVLSIFGKYTPFGNTILVDSEPSELADAAAGSPVLAIRLLGLIHPKTSPDRLVRRVKSAEWMERMAIARNMATPPNLLATLKTDPNRLVASQAKLTEAAKAQRIKQQDEMLAADTDVRIDLRPIAKEVSRRLIQDCLAWLVYGTPWWNHLSLFQRFCSVTYVADPLWRSHGSGATRRVARELIELTTLPASLAFQFASDPRAKLCVAGNSSLSIDLIQQLSCDEEAARSLITNPIVPVELRQSMATRWELYDLAYNASWPKEILRDLAKGALQEKDDEGLIALASNSNLPKDVAIAIFEHLAKKSDEAVGISRRGRRRVGDEGLTALASNPSLPEDVVTSLFERLAKSPDEHVRMSVAKNPLAPPNVLRLLAEEQGGHRQVVWYVGANPSTPVDVLETLTNDTSSYIRQHVAQNSSLPTYLIEKLADDPEVMVRAYVATNPSTPALIGDALLRNLATDSWWAARKTIAIYPRTPTNILNKLAHDAEYSVRQAVAENPVTPWDSLRRFGTDKNAGVRGWASMDEKIGRYIESNLRLIRSTGCSPTELTRLAETGLWAIRLQAIHHERFPADLREAALKVITKEIDDSISKTSARIRKAQFKPEDFVAALSALTLMPDTSNPKAMALAAKSKDWLERSAAALSPGMQPSLLRMLLDDPVETVRQLAAKPLREKASASKVGAGGTASLK